MKRYQVYLNQISVYVIDDYEKLAKISLDILDKFSEHKISFTDATSFCLYKDFNLDAIFTLDGDFKKMRVNTSF